MCHSFPFGIEGRIWDVIVFIPDDSFSIYLPGRVAQSVGHLTHKSEVLGSIPGYWRKHMHEGLVTNPNHLGGLSLLRKSVVGSDLPDITLDV